MGNPFYGVAVIAIVGACTAPIAETQLKSLTGAFGKAGGLVGKAHVLQARLIAETADNRNLCRYLSGSSYSLPPIKPGKKPSDLARAQAGVAVALGAYSKSLAAAADSKSGAELLAASKAVGAEATALGASLGADPAFGSLITGLVNLGTRLGESNRQARVRQIMSDVLPIIIELENFVVRDAPEIARQNQALAADWDKAVRCVLGQSRPDRGAAQARYDRVAAQRRDIAAELRLSAKAAAAVTALKDAHVLADDDEVDLTLLIDVVKATYEDFKPFIDQN